MVKELRGKTGEGDINRKGGGKGEVTGKTVSCYRLTAGGNQGSPERKTSG